MINTKDLARVTFNVLFDVEGSSWGHMYQFEQAIVKVFSDSGLELQVIEGQPSSYYVTRKQREMVLDKIFKFARSKPEKVTSVIDQIANLKKGIK